MKNRLGADYDDFVSAYQHDAVQSIRLNPQKKYQELVVSNSVKWYNPGKFLTEKKQFITDPLWHSGVYYVQESSSMILADIFKQLYGNDSPKQALDLCAAPGGKSTLLQTLLANDSVLIANEVIRHRVQILKENHIRLGLSENLIITQNDPRNFSGLEEFFDYIQIDAPCSGEGMFRKDKSAVNEWSEANCQLCAERQKRIIADIYPALSKEGYLVYSTCTFNPDENEKLIDWAYNQFNFKSIQLNFNSEWNISEVEYNGVFGYYFYPHKVEGEGLFVSVLKKESGFGLIGPSAVKRQKPVLIPELIESENIQNENGMLKFETKILSEIKQSVSKKLNLVYSGIELGELKGKDFIPAQALANFHKDIHHFEKVEVDEKTGLEFLRGNDPNLDLDKKGIRLLTYKGFGLGWIKFLGNRSNNYYPKPWRIRNF